MCLRNGQRIDKQAAYIAISIDIAIKVWHDISESASYCALNKTHFYIDHSPNTTIIWTPNIKEESSTYVMLQSTWHTISQLPLGNYRCAFGFIVIRKGIWRWCFGYRLSINAYIYSRMFCPLCMHPIFVNGAFLYWKVDEFSATICV